MIDLLAQFKAARRASTPLIAIQTPDPAATVALIVKRGNGTAAKLQWDAVRGLVALNPEGEDARSDMGLSEYEDRNLVEVLVASERLPEDAILFVHNAHRMLGELPVVQAVWNLRDSGKSHGRTVVLLAPTITLPPELANDVLVLDEPLPDGEALAAIVQQAHQDAQLECSQDGIARAVEAVQGLAAFAAEQVTAMSLSPEGLDIKGLWERKRQMIEQTPGLKVYRGGETFADVGGLDAIKEFLGGVVNGRARPNAVVFIDEIEKAMAGTGNDTSGVSQDQLGVLLSYMQDHQARGAILVGPPGTGKSQIAKCAGNEAGVPTIQLDLGACKGSLVGSSENMIRAALKVVTSVSNGRSLWIATSNGLGSIPPELRRRFSLGVYFFDLPSAEEREAIWRYWIGRYELDPSQNRPSDAGWTGAEIRQACDLAWARDCSLIDAARYVVPVNRSAAEQIARLRDQAKGKYLSASKPGVYEGQVESAPKRTGRKLAMQG